jgi:hypothetical protein
LQHYWFASTAASASVGLTQSNSNAQADEAGRRRATPATTAKARTTEPAAKARPAEPAAKARAAEATVEASWTAEATVEASWTAEAAATTVEATATASSATPISQLSVVNDARTGLRSRRGVCGTG